MNELIIKNFKKVEYSIVSLAKEKEHFMTTHEHKTGIELASTSTYYSTLIMKFELVLEIVCNVFFRVIETAEYGKLSTDTSACIAKMKQLGLIGSEELWFTMITRRSELPSTSQPEAQMKFCHDIFALYIDEMENLCVSVKQQYTIPV